MDLLTTNTDTHSDPYGITLTALLLALVFALSPTGGVHAQLSPGPLHRSHAFLDGVQNCQKCHDRNQQLVPAKCLACHSEIKKRLETHTGLHGKQQYDDCRTCHVEHQGVDYDLIYWKDGMQNLDHGLTGYQLLGKHATAKCRDCHLPKNIIDKTKLAAAGKDLSRTFLGMNQSCLSCHIDEHRKQLPATCNNCHTFDGWKPASGFDHGRAKYALNGKHLQVQCDKCHHQLPDSSQANEKGYVQYTGLNFNACTDCHRDTHDGRLGTDCEKCHDPSGWGVTKLAKFDHQKTRFPLLGRHSQVTCDKCHKKGEPVKGLHFTKCRDCHSDSHQGEFAHRASGGDCEECHTVNGYQQTTFTVALHQQTKYPLVGSHLAIACDDCHGKTVALKALAAGKRFTFTSTRCQACHPDIHKSTLDKYISADGCESCHDVVGWRQVKFDHGRTNFALDGKHLAASCRDCHGGKDKKTPVEQLKFVGVSRKCEDCHKDNHRGQFVQTTAAIDSTSSTCVRCHTAASWKAERFNHNRDATFKLDGAHQKVTCAGCHKPVLEAGVEFVRYKPLASTCKSCHSDNEIKDKEKGS